MRSPWILRSIQLPDIWLILSCSPLQKSIFNSNNTIWTVLRSPAFSQLLNPPPLSRSRSPSFMVVTSISFSWFARCSAYCTNPSLLFPCLSPFAFSIFFWIVKNSRVQPINAPWRIFLWDMRSTVAQLSGNSKKISHLIARGLSHCLDTWSTFPSLYFLPTFVHLSLIQLYRISLLFI